MNYIGDFAEDSTVRIVLTTNNASGGAVAPSSAFEENDFRIYKNGSATQKATTNGITIASPFDSVTGLHTLEIDTSNDTGDTGFWTTAADYWIVAVPDETVDGQTVVQPIASFSIQNRYMRGTDGANTTTPPTAAANATAVRSELTTELARIDVAVSSRLASVSYTTPPTAAANASQVRTELGLTGTLDAAFDAIPTAAANATAVRSELTTELARIDVATSTRLAGVSYTAPPSAATVADAVWDEATVDHTSTGSFGWVAGLFFQMIENVTGWRFTTKALEAGARSTGSGARSVSITVLLDGVAQQSALVRLTKEPESYLATTDEDGLAEFSVNDGTWRVSITLSGTRFTPVDLVVDGNEEVSYSLTANSAIAASDPNKITGCWLCLSQAGTPETGVTVTLTAMSLPPNSTGLILDSASRSVTTGADGVAAFTNLIPGVRYKVKRNSGREFYFVCPDYQGDPVDLASFIGT